jgi:hypothetical protein
MLLTGLLQYLTISEIKEDYEDLEDTLTPNRVSNLQTALATAQDIEEQHEKTQFEKKEDRQKKKNEQIRDMNDIADKREIVFNAKAISNGNEGLKRIATNNNVYVPTEEAKAGFVDVSFSSNQQKEDSNNISGEELIYALYADVNIDTGNEKDRKLITRAKVINATKRTEVQNLSKVYSILTKRGIVELRGNKGYFALESVESALEAYREGNI